MLGVKSLLLRLALAAVLAPATGHAQTFQTLYSFTGAADGTSPFGDLAMGPDGALYGTTSFGGADTQCLGGGCGTVFKLDPVTGVLTTLHSFSATGSDGNTPQAGLVIDRAGIVYGMTTAFTQSFSLHGGGGCYTCGTVFKLDPVGGTFTTLHTFDGLDGGDPRADLIFGQDGALYGITSTGGAGTRCRFYCGTAFRIDPVTGVLTTLHKFNVADGKYPQAAMVADGTGALYGVATFGGANAMGTAFTLDPVTQAFSTLHQFAKADGEFPYNGMVFGPDGALYGTALLGGAHNAGTIFRLDPATGALTTLHSFAASGEGRHSFAGLVFDHAGTLYGTTYYGGPNHPKPNCRHGCGTVFKFDPATGTLTTLHNFNGADGSGPDARLLIDQNGVLYGTTNFGGAHDAGTVFKIAP